MNRSNGDGEYLAVKVTDEGMALFDGVNEWLNEAWGMDTKGLVEAMGNPHAMMLLGCLWRSWQKNEVTISGSQADHIKAEIEENDGENPYDEIPDFEEMIRRGVKLGALIPDGERYRWKGTGNLDHWHSEG